jgi:glycosyltransferase involved in cell wall biosynthesis
MTPRLSIITPSYNQGEFIERTLRSVLDQGYPDLEYIVVDGGSEDGTVEILERYDDRLAWWVSEPDDGQTQALNKGLARASGEYIAYINSDDYYLPGAFDAAVAGFASSGAEWVVGSCRYVGERGQPTELWIPQPPIRSRHWWMLDPWGVPQASTFWRRDLFDRFGAFREDMHYVFDTEYGLRLIYNEVMPGFVERELAVRVVHPEAKSWNLEPFRQETRRFVDLYADKLDDRERMMLRKTQLLKRMGWYRGRSLAGRLKRRLSGGPEPAGAGVVELHD